MLYSREHRSRAESIALVIGVVSGIVAFALLAQSLSNFRPEEAGLGHDTTGRLSDYGGLRVAGLIGAPELVHETLRRVRGEGKKVVLWLGASQLHAINRIREGDEIAVFHANAAAARRESDLFYVQLSAANANLNELLGAYIQIRKEGLLPDMLVLGLTYDDLREPGIRRSILDWLPKSLELDRELLAQGGLLNLEEARVAVDLERKQALNVLGDIQDTPQQWLEEKLTGALEESFPPYAHRGKLTAAAEVAMMRFFSTLRSGATKTRVPPVPEHMKAWNLAGLDTLVELAQADGVRVLIYKPPHRPDEPVFYHDRSAYDRFFEKSQVRFRDWGVEYVDLEEIVPAEYWGFIQSGFPDVFHFQVEGHQALGIHIDAIAKQVGF